MRSGWFAVVLANTLVVSSLRGQSSPVQRLSSGDSIVVIMAGPAVVPNRSPGLLVRFYPYASLSDTEHLRDLALTLSHDLVPRLDSSGISWLVLQATDQSPGPHPDGFVVHNYGFAFERDADSVWRRTAQPDSTLSLRPASVAPAIPNLAGRWRITGLYMTELIYLSFTQQGDQIHGEIVNHRNCYGKDVKVVMELEGVITGDSVRLWSVNGRVEGEFVNPCNNAVLTRRLEFDGQIAADAKRITGPVELAGVRTDTWTFVR